MAPSLSGLKDRAPGTHSDVRFSGYGVPCGYGRDHHERRLARLADVVDSARVGHDPDYLTRRGQR